MASSTVLEIMRITQKYSFYSSTIIFTIGTIGNLLSILVFTNLKLFRNNPCVLYVVIESIANIFQLTIYVLIYSLTAIHGSDVASISLFWCKFRAMMIVLCTLVSFSAICFSAYDQYLSTSHLFYLRQMSTMKLARILLCTAIAISILQTIPFGILCEIQTSVCGFFNSNMSNYIAFFYYPVLSGILPIMTASLFSILAYRNVRRIIRRQVPIDRRRLDQQLTAMVLARIIVFVIFTLPYTILRMYAYIPKVNQSDPTFSAIFSLVMIIASTFFYLNYAASFYLFPAISSRFRRQVKYVFIKKYWRLCKRWYDQNGNQVNPVIPARSTIFSVELE